jgi:transcription antitermination factor NusA-like protein
MQRNPKAIKQIFTEGIHLITWLANTANIISNLLKKIQVLKTEFFMPYFE